ncbi:MAG: [FeFe] hydrogenase, group A [Endomicrobium sp.]|jgi:NADH-quinone oxidoreductase subunit G|nr:[FeFe] hydrogenase, group A [Endomicrobium sp.]
MTKYLVVNGKKVLFNDEKNILEIIRRENIDLLTFCYYSEFSAYGSCRLCMVEVNGKDILPACSTPPENAMKIRTNTEQIIEIRKIIVELLLANHDRECTICVKSKVCQLQTLSKRLGINDIRFKNIVNEKTKDLSTYSLVREPRKCVLCGTCVRFCDEVQGIGVLDFANRGSQSMVCSSFNKDLESSECVYCGQCARVCPTGAIVPKSEVDYVWTALSDPNKKVIVAIAPAVRAAICEVFGIVCNDGSEVAGKIVTVLHSMGFAKVFDISFSADMTIVEEADEFIRRLEENKNMPMFTSCCPAWVKFVEKYYPDFISNLSSCRSPQGMYGSVAKKIIPKMLGISKKDLVVVSIMPCTAKKFEAKRIELSKDGIPDVDYVLTTQELARMIEESGLQFEKLKPSLFDMPLGFKTGSGIIFGNSGGVTEAILRNIVNNKSNKIDEVDQFSFVRGEEDLREIKVNLNKRELNVAIICGLKNARKALEDIRINKCKYNFLEVMACPGGCIGGAGQPAYTNLSVRRARTKILYEIDKAMELHKPQDNLYVQKIYKDYFDNSNNCYVHEYLHTKYKHK